MASSADAARAELARLREPCLLCGLRAALAREVSLLGEEVRANGCAKPCSTCAELLRRQYRIAQEHLMLGKHREVVSR